MGLRDFFVPIYVIHIYTKFCSSMSIWRDGLNFLNLLRGAVPPFGQLFLFNGETSKFLTSPRSNQIPNQKVFDNFSSPMSQDVSE